MLKRLPVFLTQEMWDELTEAARFHTAAFAASGLAERVSRNDLIEDSLIWAIAAYWADKGGKPVTKTEFTERAKAFGERLKRERSQSKPDVQ